MFLNHWADETPAYYFRAGRPAGNKILDAALPVYSTRLLVWMKRKSAGALPIPQGHAILGSLQGRGDYGWKL